MGGSSSQVTGYRYFTNLLLFIGNPIEKMLGINFDKRGWLSPFVDENGNALAQGIINSPSLFGENEGGVAGVVHVKYGTDNQEVLPFYKDYMESKELQASAYPYQSYLAFTGLGYVNTGNGFIDGAFSTLAGYMNDAFYVGNSGYMKEMLLWPKRIHVRNDGRGQWYDAKAEIPEFSYYDNSVGTIEGVKILETHSLEASDSGDYSSELEFSNNIITENNIKYIYAAFHRFYASTADFNWKPNQSVQQTVLIGKFSSPKKLKLKIYSYGEPDIKIDIPPELILSRVDIVPPANGGAMDWYNQCNIELLIPKEFPVAIFLRLDNAVDTWAWDGLRARFEFYFEAGQSSIAFDSGDINPIHKIREILTDDTAMNKPESSVNDLNFMKAADQIWDEGLGISWSITEKSCIDAINELCYHIEAGIRVNRQTGLYEMILFRDNWFDENEIHTISESKIKSMQYEITNADEVINQVNVNFYDRANIKNSSSSISESGLIQTLGRVNAETVDFPYFMNMRNAEIVANWKLKLLSTGVYKGSFTTGWREARKWNRYDLIRLPWSKRWTGTILVRIMSINLGGPTNNEVSIDFIEVVPSTGMMNTTIVADDPIEKPLPPQACQYEPFELPYYLAVMALGQRKVDDELAYENNFGLVGVVAEQPQSNSLYAVMMTNNYDEWVRAGSIQYSETVDSDQWISKVSTSFTVKNWKKIANVPVGTLIQCGKEWLTGFVEWMVFQGVDPHTGVVSVKRGALDTQPQDWDLGLKLYFCGTDVAYDATEYVAGEKVLVSALTTTPSGVLEQKGSNSVEMKARAIRPYPPANVKINGEYWPEEIETDLILTWVDRNRVQQTGGEVIGWFEGGVTIEPNTQTHLILSQLDENDNELATANANVTGTTSYTMPISAMQASTRTVRVTLKTVRDGYECLNPFVHIVELSKFFSAPYDLNVEFKND